MNHRKHPTKSWPNDSMTPSDLLSTSFEFHQGAATKWSGRMTGAKPKVAALVEKGSIQRAESCINGVMTWDAVMKQWCKWQWNRMEQKGTDPVGVLLPISTCLAEATDSAGSRRESTQCTKRYLRRGRSCISVETPNASRPGHIMKNCYFSRQMWSASTT